MTTPTPPAPTADGLAAELARVTAERDAMAVHLERIAAVEADHQHPDGGPSAWVLCAVDGYRKREYIGPTILKAVAQAYVMCPLPGATRDLYASAAPPPEDALATATGHATATAGDERG